MRWRALAATWRLNYLRITYDTSTVRIYSSHLQCDPYKCTVRTLSFYSAIYVLPHFKVAGEVDTMNLYLYI